MSQNRTIINKIKNRYDAEHDTDLTAPPVTWVEADLLVIIEDLLDRIEDLEKPITNDSY